MTAPSLPAPGGADDLRFGIDPRFSVHIAGERQVLLLSEQRSFRLTGALYLALLPLLDGTLTFAGIRDALAGRAPEETLRTTLERMIEKGYAVHLDDRAPSSRQALWSELGLAPAEAERRLAKLKIGVAAPGQVAGTRQAATMVRGALADLGIVPAKARQADLVVACVDDQADGALAEFDRRMRRQGRAWIPFKPAGAEARFGPLFRPDGAPCWHCLVHALLENRPGDALLSPDVAARPARAWSRASLMAATGVAALELVRHLAGDDSQDLERRMLAFGLRERSLSSHFVRTMPHCAVCGEAHDPADVLRAASQPMTLLPRRLGDDADGGWRVASAADVVRRLTPYVSPLTGLVTGLEDRSPSADMPVVFARQAMPGAQAGPRQNRLVGKPAGAAGKGRSLDQARAGCLAEAVERYLAGYTGVQPRRRAVLSDLEPAAVHPARLLQFSVRQFANRAALNQTSLPFNWIPEPFDQSRPLDWTPAWSLTHETLRWLPTRYCYFDYRDGRPAAAPENLFCVADSNGCAAGSNLEEAILQGVLELVERDATALWWYNRLRRPAFDLSSCGDPFVRQVQAFHDRAGRGLDVLNLTTDLGIPVAAAISHRRADGGGLAIGMGAHPDAAIAISRALTEVNQVLGGEAMIAVGQVSQADTGMDLDMVRWFATETLDSQPYCRPLGRTDPEGYPKPRVTDLREGIDLCVRRLGARGLEVIALDLSRPEIDFAAARVVVPGLRHFWSRLAPGRLYDVPVELGWLPAALTESELNPIGFFL